MDAEAVEQDRWVVWGNGAAPDDAFSAEPGDDIARGIARGADADWNEDEGWAVVVTAAEEAVDEFVRDSDSARGYAPHLVPGRREEMLDRPMRGVLRSDVAPRRKVDQPRPS